MTDHRTTSLLQRLLATTLSLVLLLNSVPAEALAEMLDATTPAGDGQPGIQITEVDTADGDEAQELLDSLDAAEPAAGQDSATPVDDQLVDGQIVDELSADEPAIDAQEVRDQVDQAVEEAAEGVRAAAGDDQSPEHLTSLVYHRLAQVEDLYDELDVEVDSAETMLSYATLGSLTAGETTAAGITHATQLVLGKLDIESIEVQAADAEALAAGEAPRRWVMVHLGEGWYHMDAASAAGELLALKAMGEETPETPETWLLVSDDTLKELDDQLFPLTAVEGAEGTEVPEAAEDFAPEQSDEEGDEAQAEADVADADDTEEQPDAAADDAIPAESDEVEDAEGTEQPSEVSGEQATTEAEGAGQDEAAEEAEATEAQDATEAPGDFTINPDQLKQLIEDYSRSNGKGGPARAAGEFNYYILGLDGKWYYDYLEEPNWDSYLNNGYDLHDLSPNVYRADVPRTGWISLDFSCTGYKPHGISWVVIDDNGNTIVGQQKLWCPESGGTATAHTDTRRLSAGRYHVLVLSLNYEEHYYIRSRFMDADVSRASVSSIPAKPYTGKAIKPYPTVTLNGTTLRAGTDYTVSWKNNVKVGTAKVIIKGIGARYTGSKTVTFSIKRNIAKAKVNKIKARTYNGKKHKPKPVVKWGSKKLKRGTHYTLSYKKNRNAGTAKVIIKGKGKYAGSKTVKFKIKKRSLSKAKVSKIKARKYSGKAKKPKPKVKVGKRTLKRKRDYTLSYKNNKMPGKARIIIKGKGNYKGKRVVRFKIKRGQYYTMKRDTWKFYNFGADIPLSIYKRVFRSSALARRMKRRDGYSNGCCYGMSMSVEVMARYKTPKLTTFKSGSKRAYSIYQIGKSWKTSNLRLSGKKMTAKQMIMCMQLMQYDYRLQREENNHYNGLNGLVSAIRKSVKGGKPVVVSIFGYDYSSGSRTGHAIVPIKVKSNTSSYTTVAFYDCNFPNHSQEMVFYKSGGRYYSWSYRADYDDISWRDITWGTPADDSPSLFKYGAKRGATNEGSDATLVSVTGDATLVSTDGASYQLSSEASNDPDKVLRILTTGTNAASELYWVNLDSNRMGFKDLAEGSTVSVTTNEGGVEATVSAGSEVVMDVNEAGAGTVVVDTGESPEFQMSFDDGTNEVVVEGTAEGIVVGQQEEGALLLSGVDTVSVSDGSESTGEVELDPEKTYQVEVSGDAATTTDETPETEDGSALLTEILGADQQALPFSDDTDEPL